MTNKNKILSGATIAAISAILLAWGPSTAYAGIDGTFICNSNIVGGTINANLVVPSGEFCDLDGVTVNGNVIIEPNAELSTDDSTINGNIKGTNGSSLNNLRDSVLNGNLSLVDCDEADIDDDNTINGNVSIIGCNFVDFEQNDVSGNVRIAGNNEVFIQGASMLGKNLTVEGNGEVTFFDIDGPISIGKNLTVSNNDEVDMQDVIVDKNATCSGNTILTGSGNTFNGKNNGCP